ncbi:hypothetical protein EFA69_14595 [Rufibacter immobilis]|uniref:DNA-directed DNA polymerase family A palm domain-containing protein n=1 Tax=Rufibacter immobilis TaxID=1348778 RepID=A0A3M9MQ77_9BACT|nr:hypothetical protein [Rufibacter immobilis]RNI27365.1 hypothetical protein EFA69_14595 [Rufibacter immobilis]
MKTKDREKRLYIPSKVNLPELILAHRSERYRDDHQDKYAYVLSKIIEQKIFTTQKVNGLVPLHAGTLKKVINNIYKQVLDDLLAWGVIVTDNHYITSADDSENAVSKGYGIASPFQSKAIEIMILKEDFAKKIHRKQVEKGNKPAYYILSQLKNILIRDIDAMTYIDAKYASTIGLIDSLPSDNLYERYTQAIGQMPDKMVYTIKNEDDYERTFLNDPVTLKGIMIDKYNADFYSIQNIVNRNYSWDVDKISGRVYSFVTNLSRDLRQFLYHRNYPDTPLVNVDIRNSQPFIFCSLLQDYYQHQLPLDAREYIMLCSTGKLYDMLMDEMGYKGSRKEFKQLLFSTLFYCKNYTSNKSIHSEYFRERFPSVYRCISHFKKGNYKRLSHMMQKAEADLMIQKVVKSLMRTSVFLTTVHDSIIALESDVDLVRDTIIKYFQKEHSLRPSLDDEYLRKVNVEAIKQAA